MKILLYLLLFVNIIFANESFSVKIIEDKNYSFDSIKNVKRFNQTTNTIKFKTSKDFWLKLEFDNLDSSKEYVLEAYSKLYINPVKFENNQTFLQNNVTQISGKKNLYIKVLTPKNKINLHLYIEEKNKFIGEFLKRKEFYGISYGVIFAAILYYFAFYIFNKEKSFIYYCLTQIFILLIIYFSYKEYRLSFSIYQFFIFGFMVFSTLFTKEFLNTKKYVPLLNKLLNLFLIVCFFKFVLSFFSIHFSLSFLLLLYLISAIAVYMKNSSIAILFYILGWSLVVLTYIFVDIQSDFIFKEINPLLVIDIIHFAIPLESLILAFALSYKMKINEDEKKEKQGLIIHQNRLSSMGEMMSNITHQWRQPLTHLGYLLLNINSAYKHKKLNQEYLDNKISEANQQLHYMSNTLEDFKNFYSPLKEKNNFSVKTYSEKALDIFSSYLEVNNIDVEISGKDFIVYGSPNEFSQVILNLLNNAKDAFISNEIKNAKIKIVFEDKLISITDNAKGIDNKIKEKIFEPYFTTKENGGGIGLYMSKIIIEKSFNGKLYHKNIDRGSCFFIDFK